MLRSLCGYVEVAGRAGCLVLLSPVSHQPGTVQSPPLAANNLERLARGCRRSRLGRKEWTVTGHSRIIVRAALAELAVQPVAGMTWSRTWVQWARACRRTPLTATPHDLDILPAEAVRATLCPSQIGQRATSRGSERR